ncbi:hypothetical protein MKK70_04220 [Methylobacterium sp. E-041]|uniref:hypothetical protein n=1 Tax=Methylobacterium sp. E-041 TaxID=2836573 RepID=UPI001FBA89A9|nr:hypothetical protein [Methylobacterium sp. E-041]MCJ2104597.1 hypothetical protein [Methylobacterium sp. E-041]
MSDDTTALILALASENAELRAALTEAQELLVETAVDAGELHARVGELEAEVAALRAEREATARSTDMGHSAELR